MLRKLDTETTQRVAFPVSNIDFPWVPRPRITATLARRQSCWIRRWLAGQATIALVDFLQSDPMDGQVSYGLS